MPNPDYEKLGVFYLGRRYDLKCKETTRDLLLYESRDLVTHGLVVGMTGSGKTGLCLDLIEEAAIDGIPALVIDPKGDLGNLLLTFPDLRPDDVAPWINPDDAERAGLSLAEFASKQAKLWADGLASWGQDGDRIRRLKAAAEFGIYTPGSTAGRPLSVLSSFQAPPAEILEDGELLRERVSSTVAGLLGLAGINADPIQSRESILLANLLPTAWGGNRSLDLATLIQEVQRPSVQRIGVLDVDSFMPVKERFALAMRLNNLLAAPNFAAWMEGEPLDIGRLLHTPAGKPRVAIMSIAHLGDSERMFFVTLLLNQVLAWMRAQSGTNSLRALVYMDEIYGYFPPVANPPSKPPLLTLLKQARAFGVGLVLATQNPVDLDYKGLANIGTWFIGRLQTDRDKARVLEGLEGAAAGRGEKFDRPAAERILAGLGSRVFLLHNVHANGLQVFESRWTMSYLRGPLSRNQIRELSGRDLAAAPRDATLNPGSSATNPAGSPASIPSGRPSIPPGVPQFFVPLTRRSPEVGVIEYQPRVLAAAQVRYSDAKLKVDLAQDILVMTEITENALPVEWRNSEALALSVNELEKLPASGDFAPCAPAASQAKNYAGWSRDFLSWVQSERPLSLLRSASLAEISRPGEPEREFRIRLQQAARERRDKAAEKLRQAYAPKMAALQDRLRRAQATKDKEAEQARSAQLNTVLSIGSTLLGAFLGRKVVSATNIAKAATAVRSAGRAYEQSSDVGRAEESLEAIQKHLQDLDTQFESEVGAQVGAESAAAEPLETLRVRASKTNIKVCLVALGWLPFVKNSVGGITPAYKTKAE